VVSKRKRSEIGRQLAALRTKVQITCAYCGTTVTGIKQREYCSARCRMAACRERKKGEQEENDSV
jgi:hypothetical protein